MNDDQVMLRISYSNVYITNLLLDYKLLLQQKYVQCQNINEIEKKELIDNLSLIQNKNCVSNFVFYSTEENILPDTDEFIEYKILLTDCLEPIASVENIIQDEIKYIISIKPI